MNNLRNSLSSMEQSNPFNMSAQLPFNSEVLYEKDLDICVRINSAQQSHPITFSCLLPRGSNGSKIRLLFTSKDDLFFLYTIQYDFSYKINKDRVHHLNAEFDLKLEGLEEFLEMFRDLLEEIEKGTKQACLKFSNQSTLALEIATIINGKQFPILTLVAQKQPHEVIQSWTAFKYGEMRQQIRRSEQKISQLRQLIRLKNPYLFNYIDKIGH